MHRCVRFIAFVVLVFLVGCARKRDVLEQQALKIFGTLPSQMLSPQNPITLQKVLLGRMLFYETRISVDGTVSCARCHPMSFYATDKLKKSIGNSNKQNPHNAPTLFNAANQISEHWIGNRIDVEDQARQALIAPQSFGMPSNAAVEEKLRQIHGYRQLFADAFPGDSEPITVDNFAKAIGAFERTLTTPGRFDAFVRGNDTALDSSEKAGLALFMEKGCAACHSGARLGGGMYRKFGIANPYWRYTKSDVIDKGRYAVTHADSDLYVFKVPILRNVSMTSPYFHDGSVASLRDAVGIMSKVQLGETLSEEQVSSLVLFLGSLTGRIRQDFLVVPLLPAE